MTGRELFEALWPRLSAALREEQTIARASSRRSYAGGLASGRLNGLLEAVAIVESLEPDAIYMGTRRWLVELQERVREVDREKLAGSRSDLESRVNRAIPPV